MKTQKDNKIGGALLLIGIVIFFITVYLEFQIGWIGSPRSQDPAAVPNFLKEHWSSLKGIWGWQTFASFLFTLGYFHLTKIKRTLFQIPLGSLWAILFITSIMVLVSLGITLGSYEQAISIYDTNPEQFTTIRAAVLGLHGFGSEFNMVIMLVIFIYEVVSKNGVIPKVLGFIILGLLITSFSLMLLNIIPGKIIGLAYFLMPLTLGYCYFKNKAINE